MEQLKGKVLDLLRPEIVEKLDPEDNVLKYLHTNNFITDKMQLLINSHPVRVEQNRILILAVKRKELFDEFIKALRYKGSHLKLAEKLVTKLKELSCTRYQDVGKVDTMCGRTKRLTLMSFKLHMLPMDGDIQRCVDVSVKMQVEHRQDPDVLFRVLDSHSSLQRILSEDLGQSIDSMERLVAYTTNSEVSSMTFLAWKGSACSKMGKFDEALHFLELAKQKTLMLQPCLDTGRMLFTYANVLIIYFETFPNLSNRHMVIAILRETISHFSECDPEIRQEFSRILNLKLAYVHLGVIISRGGIMFTEVTEDDLKAARFYIAQVECSPGKFSKRRKMFISIAKAVLIFRSGEGTLEYALALASEAERLAAVCGFKTERPYLTEFIRVLHGRESTSNGHVEEDMDVSQSGDEEKDMELA